MDLIDDFRINEEVLTNKKDAHKRLGHFRSRSLTSMLHLNRPTELPVLSSVPSRSNFIAETGQSSKWYKRVNAVVTIVLIEGKDLNTNVEEAICKFSYFIMPRLSSTKHRIARQVTCDSVDGNMGLHEWMDKLLYILIVSRKLGSDNYKSKLSVRTAAGNAEWKERFKLNLYNDMMLNISLWTKGREKNALAKCTLDLSTLERERTHDLCIDFEEGGNLHLSVTICTNTNLSIPCSNTNDNEKPSDLMSWISQWKVIGELRVTVCEARGLPITSLDGRVSAYCALELDNERVQTPNTSAYNVLHWSKTRYTFNIYDMTSTLIIKVYNKAVMNGFKDEILGRVSIPLLRIQDGEQRWYALKDKSRRNHAKGNCPRILLKISLSWDAVKASSRLFRPKEFKYVKKPMKFDMRLLYKNVEFIRDLFHRITQLNENLKDFLEWDDEIKCKQVLVGYLIFCYFFRLWMTPVVVIGASATLSWWGKLKKLAELNKYYTVTYEEQQESLRLEYNPNIDKGGTGKSFTGKLHDIQDMTLTISKGIEFIATLIERIHNLTNFAVPFLTKFTIFLMVVLTIALYFIPFNYILMCLGIYKYARKRLQPDRTPNNDILDFISHVPDRGMLSDWKELDVPEYESENLSEKIVVNIPIKDLKKLSPETSRLINRGNVGSSGLATNDNN